MRIIQTTYIDVQVYGHTLLFVNYLSTTCDIHIFLSKFSTLSANLDNNIATVDSRLRHTACMVRALFSEVQMIGCIVQTERAAPISVTGCPRTLLIAVYSVIRSV